MDERSLFQLRSYGFFNPDSQRLNIHIMGVGSIGSLLTLNLSKIGFNDITCYDYDIVEPQNIGNQFYRVKDIGKPKLNALKEIIKEFPNIDIKTINKEIKTDNITEIIKDINLNSLIVLCFDNLEIRKIVFEALKGTPIPLLDIRMGGKSFEIYVIDLSNEKECKVYEISLNNETTELPCGFQSILYCLSNISAEASQIITQINNQEPYKKLLKRNMNSYYFISH